MGGASRQGAAQEAGPRPGGKRGVRRSACVCARVGGWSGTESVCGVCVRVCVRQLLAWQLLAQGARVGVGLTTPSRIAMVSGAIMVPYFISWSFQHRSCRQGSQRGRLGVGTAG
jgi:hypothetical protein